MCDFKEPVLKLGIIYSEMFGYFALNYLIVHIGLQKDFAFTLMHFVSIVRHSQQQSRIQKEGHLEDVSEEKLRGSGHLEGELFTESIITIAQEGKSKSTANYREENGVQSNEYKVLLEKTENSVTFKLVVLPAIKFEDEERSDDRSDEQQKKRSEVRLDEHQEIAFMRKSDLPCQCSDRVNPICYNNADHKYD